jgi:hypothetical protein
MKKNIVTLTESELKNVIKESVKTLLTEMDWRSYSYFQQIAIEKSNDKTLSKAERNYYKNLAQRLEDKKNRVQASTYDGVNELNYENEKRWPDSKITNADGNERYERLNNYPVNGKVDKVSNLKQMNGAKSIGRFNRGGDEYNSEKHRWERIKPTNLLLKQ